jgi:hypothetical protein
VRLLRRSPHFGPINLDPMHATVYITTMSRSAAQVAGLRVYHARRVCAVSAHGSLRRVSDNKCCGCIQWAKDKEAATRQALREKALAWARAEVVQEQRREAKRLAGEALQAEKAALRVKAQAARDKAKRARLKGAREAEKARKAAATAPVGSPAATSVRAPAVVMAGSLGVPPWEEVGSAVDHSDDGCPWGDDSPPWD